MTNLLITIASIADEVVEVKKCIRMSMWRSSLLVTLSL